MGFGVNGVSTTLVIVGALIASLSLTAALAVYAPIQMPSRLFAAGLSFVPLWVAMSFCGIALKRARYRVVAFVALTGTCVALVLLHVRGLS